MRLTSRSVALGLLLLAAMTHALAASAGGPLDASAGSGGAGGNEACNTQVPGVCESATPDPTACSVSEPGHSTRASGELLAVLVLGAVVAATGARRR